MTMRPSCGVVWTTIVEIWRHDGETGKVGEVRLAGIRIPIGAVRADCVGGTVALYDMTAVKSGLELGNGSLIKLQRTSFASENILERTHLQAALRDHIGLIDEGLHVVAEEFGDLRV